VPEMDEGPIIAQAAITVLDTDTVETLGARVLSQEHRLYPMALNLVASGALQIIGNRVIGAVNKTEGALIAPSC